MLSRTSLSQTLAEQLRLAVLACLIAAVAVSNSFAQTTKRTARDTPSTTPKKLKAGDGFPLAITYFNSTSGRESPAVILLHDKGRNQVGWERVASSLQAHGLAVVTVDLRMHGLSKPDGGGSGNKDRRKPEVNLRPADYQKMVSDLDTVKEFLMERHHEQKLNIRKTAIVAIGMSVPIAIQYAAFDWGKAPYDDGPTYASRTPRGQDIRALMFMSPMLSLPGLKTQKGIKTISDPRKKIAFLLRAGMGDDKIRADSEKLQKQLSAANQKKDDVVLLRVGGRPNGHDFLNERNAQKTADIIKTFLDKNLSSIDEEWRVRKSRLEL